MSIHIKMSNEAELELKNSDLRNKQSSLIASLVLLFFCGSILYLMAIYSVQRAIPEFVIYSPENETTPTLKRPSPQEISISPSSPANLAPRIIMCNTSLNINLAHINVPSLSTHDSSNIGLGPSIGNLGDGLGPKSETAMGGENSNGSALEGSFYDLKQTRAGASTGIHNANSNQVMREDFGKICEFLGDFFHKNWAASALNKFFQSPQKLYASHFMLPNCEAKYAPIAYKCAHQVKAGGWVAIYRGKIRAPKSGKFRFIGTGDDLLAVKLDKKVVLEAGWVHPSMYKPSMSAQECWASFGEVGVSANYKNALKNGTSINPNHAGYKLVQVPGISRWNNEGGLGGLAAGHIFEVKAGEVIPIEILLSEVPGGGFGFALLVEDIDDPQENYDIFRTNFSLPDRAEIETLLRKESCFRDLGIPQFNEDSLIWTTVP